MKYVIVLLAALVSFPAFAQPNCTAVTTTPTAARDETRLVWGAPTQNTDGSPIVGAISYKVYRATGAGAFAVQCVTSAVTVSLLAQPLGVQNYRVTASVAGFESVPSNVATKTIVSPTPNPPGNLTLLEQLIAFIKRLFAHFV